MNHSETIPLMVSEYRESASWGQRWPRHTNRSKADTHRSHQHMSFGCCGGYMTPESSPARGHRTSENMYIDEDRETGIRKKRQIVARVPYHVNGSSDIFPIIGHNVNRDMSNAFDTNVETQSRGSFAADVSPAIAHSSTYNTNIAQSLNRDLQNSILAEGPWVRRNSYSNSRDHLYYTMSRDNSMKRTIENNAIAQDNRNRYQSIQRFSAPVSLGSEVPQVSERLSMNNVILDDSLSFAPEMTMLIEDSARLRDESIIHGPMNFSSGNIALTEENLGRKEAAQFFRGVVNPTPDASRVNARSYRNNANVAHSVNFALENNVGRDHSTPTLFDDVSDSPVTSSAIIHAFTENPNIADSVNREIDNSAFVTCDLSTLSRHCMYGNLNTVNRMKRRIENSTVTEQARNRHQLDPLFCGLVNTAPEDFQVSSRVFVSNIHREDSMNVAAERSASTTEALDLRGSALMEGPRRINLNYENIALTEENLNRDRHVSSSPVISSVITHSSIENTNKADSTTTASQNGIFTNGSLATCDQSSHLRDHMYYNMNIDNRMHRSVENSIVIEETRNRHESINQSAQIFTGLENAVPGIRQTNTHSLTSNTIIEGSPNVTSGDSVLQDAALDLRGNANSCCAIKLSYENILFASENVCRNYQASTNTAQSVNRSLQNNIFTEDPRAISNISSVSPYHFHYNMNIDNRINHASENNTYMEEIRNRYQPATQVFENLNTINEESSLIRARDHLHAYQNDVNRVPGILPTTLNSQRENMNIQGFIDGIVESNGHMEDNLPSTSGTNYSYEIFPNNNPPFSLPPRNAPRLPSANMRTNSHMNGNADQYDDMGLSITAYDSENGVSPISLISNPCSSLNRHSVRETVNVYNHVNWTRRSNGNTNNENGISEISSINVPSIGANSYMGNVDHNRNFGPENSAYFTHRQGRSSQRQHASRVFSHLNNFSEICPIRANAFNENENITHVICDPETNVHAELVRRQLQLSSSIINNAREASENFSFAQLRQGEMSNASSHQNWAFENAQEPLSSFESRNTTAASSPINAYPENFYASLENHRFRGVTQQVSYKRKRMERCNEISTTKRNSYVDREGNTTCAICLDDFELHDNVRVLACRHEFHTHCLNPWLKMNPTCPLCRIFVRE
uniref:RING-type domain-containing protein n=1 Tax=Glossina palpalis gambiensis TaxID=67801 RepID=A0A1B0BMB2_9MUSC